jgi:hypothetical protein
MNIFNIQQEYLELMEILEENEGELTPELEQRLAINQQDLEHKVKAYHHIITILKGDTAVIDDEVARLNKIKETKTNTIERLRKVLLDTTILFGEDGKSGNKKLKFDTLNMWTTNRQSVNVDENDFFDAPFTNMEYIEFVIKERFNIESIVDIENTIGDINIEKIYSQTEIKNAIEDGETVIGAELVTKPSLTIK